MCPPSTLCTAGAIASMTKPGRMPASRQAAASASITPSEKRSVSCASAAVGLRGGPERRCRRPARSRQRRARRTAPATRPPPERPSLSPHCGKLRTQQDRLEGQPFGGKAVQRRQRRDRRATGENRERRQRHAVDKPAQLVPYRVRPLPSAPRRSRRTTGS